MQHPTRALLWVTALVGCGLALVLTTGSADSRPPVGARPVEPPARHAEAAPEAPTETPAKPAASVAPTPAAAPAAPRPMAIMPDNGGRIRRLAIQFASVYGTRAALDMISGLPDARIAVVVADEEEQAALLGSLPPPLMARIELLQVDSGLTLWARDAFAVVSDGSTTELWVRPEHPTGEDRQPDRRVPEVVADWMPPPTLLKPSRVYFEGGNMVADDKRLYVGVNTVDEHGADAELIYTGDFEYALHTQFRRPVMFIGSVDDPVPLVHLDMYMTPIGNDTVVIGDPAWGAGILAGLPADRVEALERLYDGRVPTALPTEPFSFKKWIAYNQRPAVIARFDRLARTMIARGYTVVRMPMLTGGGDTNLPVATYNNVVQEHLPGRARVLVASYGIAELDVAGHEVWSELGFETHPVDISSLIDLEGAVRCLTSVLDRDPRP